MAPRASVGIINTPAGISTILFAAMKPVFGIAKTKNGEGGLP
jgi:hypothetical protein